MAIHIFVICLVVLGLQNIISITIHKKRFSKQVDELQKQLDEKKEESELVMREMLSNITHDLKTPLTAIRGYAQGILDGVAATPDRMNKYISTIRNKADDMANLVNELSLFAQIYNKEIEYKKGGVEIDEYISRCMSNLSLDLETRKIDFLYRNDVEKGTCLYIDEEKIKRVFYNVIGNAYKYIDKDLGMIFLHIEDAGKMVWVRITVAYCYENTTIRIDAHRKRGDVEIIFQNEGKKIPGAKLQTIFEKFYRVDNSRSTGTGGAGLGLAIAKKIIEDHGGQIYAESEKGKGTKISFSLPKKVDEKKKI